VRGVGIGFMVFYPRLYTDTTDSWRLPRKQRLLIDAAGIIAEVLFGGIAALVWSYSPPGIMNSTMFYIFAVSTISSLLVNGNPCIRYDGYYILCDLLNIDNLMGRSADFFKHWWRWTFLRLGTAPTGEHKFIFLFFGIVSTVYRVFLYTSIILVIYHKFTKFLAVIMIFLELYSIFIYPCWKELQTIKHLSQKSVNKARYILLE
jgi:putative peptide zinc metalloprotease protein